MRTKDCPVRCSNPACKKLATHPPGYKGGRGRPRLDAIPKHPPDKPLDTPEKVKAFLKDADAFIKKQLRKRRA